MQLMIYGAQGYALGTYEAIKTLYPERRVSCFLVTERGYNAPVLEGLPVFEIDSFAEGISDEGKRDIKVLIATPENVQAEIENTLDKYGFSNHKRIDSVRWAELMDTYHKKLGRFLSLKSLPVGRDDAYVYMYAAKSHKDRTLSGEVNLPNYVTPLQVGAANTELRVAELYDSEGENISSKNGNYSELSGLYWIWKNRLCGAGNGRRYCGNRQDENTSVKNDIVDDERCEYYGLVQYRRMFGFAEEDLKRLVDNDVDVVLPYPLLYDPDINAHHERYIKEADWNALLTAIRELQPEYAEYMPVVLGQRYLYNYNVILAKKDVLRDYCEWLFPILERVEDLSVPKGSERADRYIGYMGETLETLYFIKNTERLKIAHTGCRMWV
ncbi:MAG: DUF4422 domain-containing protein [Lachnospiraceae bacterium]|nr:DUF4422 domain-containing protein [Lachnospiraceae bacterium]